MIEPASGLTRAVLVLLCEAYTPDADRGRAAMYLKFNPQFAPIKARHLPAGEQGRHARGRREAVPGPAASTSPASTTPKQAIGKRYARMDEIGTPFCVTIDGETLKDQTVTVRDRDTMSQERIALDKVLAVPDGAVRAGVKER